MSEKRINEISEFAEKAFDKKLSNWQKDILEMAVERIEKNPHTPALSVESKLYLRGLRGLIRKPSPVNPIKGHKADYIIIDDFINSK